MDRHPHRVLVDLSFAGLGYCGIAQESRLFFHALHQLDGVEPTGLIYGRNDANTVHQFPRGRSADCVIENQALFLQSMVDGRPRSRFRGIRILQSLCEKWRELTGLSVQLQPADVESFCDLIWRNLFAKSLSASELDIARQTSMLLANVGPRMLRCRAMLGLPSPRLDATGHDFVVFQDSQVIRVAEKSCKIIRYHDLIPGLRPDLVDCPAAIRNHFQAIRRCLGDSIYACISEPTRNDLVRAFPALTNRTVVIPDVLAENYYPDHQPRRIPQILASRQSSAAAAHPAKFLAPMFESKSLPPFLIATSTVEPRKNYVGLIRSFEEYLARHDDDLRLIIVGNPGWKSKETLRAMAPLITRGRLFHLENVPTAELRVLYSHARALVFPSFYEGFGYAPLEAMRCGTPAIASDIAAHRWVYGDAALYCDPYSVESLVESLERLLKAPNDSLRRSLIARGFERVRRYDGNVVAAQWRALFDELRRQRITHNVADARLEHFDPASAAKSLPTFAISHAA